MTNLAIPPDPASGAEGYWTIQIVNQDRSQAGRRYVCHAAGDAQARSIAQILAGSARTTVGYDYHRIDNPHGAHALRLGVGQSEIVHDPAAWTVLNAARRSN
jgi:hypothetical protein